MGKISINIDIDKKNKMCTFKSMIRNTKKRKKNDKKQFKSS